MWKNILASYSFFQAIRLLAKVLIKQVLDYTFYQYVMV